jgi:hypothetical protein
VFELETGILGTMWRRTEGSCARWGGGDNSGREREKVVIGFLLVLLLVVAPLSFAMKTGLDGGMSTAPLQSKDMADEGTRMFRNGSTMGVGGT